MTALEVTDGGRCVCLRRGGGGGGSLRGSKKGENLKTIPEL